MPTASDAVLAALDSLDPDDRARAVEVVVFGPEALVPVDSVIRLWGRTADLPASESQLLCARLVDLGLLVGVAPDTIAVPIAVISRVGGGVRRAELHRALVDAHRDLVPSTGGRSRWTDLDPAHDHWWRFLPGHLDQAGLLDERIALFDDPRWLVDALGRRGPDGAATELDESSERSHHEIAESVREEAHVLTPLDPPGSVAATLAARLGPEDDDTGGLRERLLAGIDGPHLVRVGPPSATEPQALRVLDDPGHEPGMLVVAIAVAPDGSWLAALDDATVRVWDPATGRLLRRIPGLYTTEVDLTVRRGARLVRRIPGVDDRYVRPSFTTPPDGSVLAVAHHRRVELIDPTGGTVHTELTGFGTWSSAGIDVVHAPDGSWFAVAGSASVEVWDRARGVVLAELDGRPADVGNATVVAPDGSWIATSQVITGDEDEEPPCTVRIWDPGTGEVLHTLPDDDGRVCALGVAPDGSWLVTVGERVQIWDPLTGALRHTVDGPGCLDVLGGPVAVAPDGSSFAYTGEGEEDATVVVAQPDGRVRHTFDIDTIVQEMRYTPDGTRIAVDGQWHGGDDQVRMWDPVTGEDRGSVPGGAPFALAPDGTWIATTWHPDPRRALVLGVWSLRPVPAPEPVAAPDGTWVASADAGGAVVVRDAADGPARHVLHGHSGPVTALAAVAGDRLASCGTDGTVRVWDPVAGRVVAALRVGVPLSDLTVDGDRLVVVGAGETHAFVLVEGPA